MKMSRCRTCGKELPDLKRRFCEEHESRKTKYMREWERRQTGPQREKRLKRLRDYTKKNRPKDNKNHIRHRMLVKMEIIAAYGGACSCCGEKEIAFLTLHHPNGDGGKHRKELSVKAGVHYYRKVKKMGYPPGLLEVQCFNCHMAARTFGGCPHKRVGDPYADI